MPLIDADTHVIETDRTWDYLEGTDRQYRPIPVTPDPLSGEVRKWWVVDGQLSIRGGAPRPNPVPVGAKEMSDLPARLHQMDEYGVELQILYPTFFLHPVSKRPEVELALCRSYNRWLADIWSKEKRRFRWVVVPPLMSMDETLTELEIAHENGACGVFMRGVEGTLFLDEPYFFPLYEKASQLDLPVCIHAGNGSYALHETYMSNRQSGPFLSLITPVYHAFQVLMMSDVPDRFPKLRVGFIEACSQWVPFIVHEAARRYQRQGSKLKDDPVRANRFYVTCRTDDDIPYVMKYTGPDNLIIGTDYGHTDLAAEIDALETMRKQSGVDPAIIDRILCDNPRTFYALEG